MTASSTLTPSPIELMRACLARFSSSPLCFLTVSPHLGLTVMISILDPQRELTLLFRETKLQAASLHVQGKCKCLQTLSCICVILFSLGHNAALSTSCQQVLASPFCPPQHPPDSGWPLQCTSLLSCSFHH